MNEERAECGVPIEPAGRMQQVMLGLFDLMDEAGMADFPHDLIVELDILRLKFMDEFERRFPDSKGFNSQTVEARAAAFGGCMSGGDCSRLEGMSINGRGTTLSYKDGKFTLTQERAGWRLPERTFKPEDFENDKK